MRSKFDVYKIIFLVYNLLLFLSNYTFFNRNADFNASSLFAKSEIPEEFFSDILECARLFKSHQEEAILRNLTLYNLPAESQALSSLKEDVAARYMEKYRPVKLPNSKFLVGHRKLQVPEWKIALLGHARRTSLLRIPQNKKDWMNLKEELNAIMLKLNEFDVIEVQSAKSKYWRCSVSLTRGKSYGRILNSKFCHARIFTIFKTLESAERNQDFHLGHDIDEFVKAAADLPLKNALLEETQNNLLNCFLKQVPLIQSGEMFSFQSIPLLSRFAVSSLWLISQLFEKV